eukprot:gene9036-18715_t
MLPRLASISFQGHKKRVYSFKDGSSQDAHLFGTKGSILCEMRRRKLPVPDGCIITTETCNEYFQNNKVLPSALITEYKQEIKNIENRSGYIFGSADKKHFPLLFSVRCGAPFRITGLMGTVLNLGINDEVAETLAILTNNPKFAYDTYRRFIQMFGTSVLCIEEKYFQTALQDLKDKKGIKVESDFSAQDLFELIQDFKKIAPVPDDVWEQLYMAIEAGFASWNAYTPRLYRALHRPTDTTGTAIILQCMVYGNLNKESGTGIAYSRNPCTGEKAICGEFLVKAEGDEVLTGTMTTLAVEDLKGMDHIMSPIYDQLDDVLKALEKMHKDMQASVRIAVEMVKEGVLTEREALLRIDASKMSYFRSLTVDNEPDAYDFNVEMRFNAINDSMVCRGVPASAGCVSGMAVFSCKDAVWYAEKGQSVILICDSTSPEDLIGITAASGILTVHGGLASHAAETCRNIGQPAVTGLAAAGGSVVLGNGNNGDGASLICGFHKISTGDLITIDGTRGAVYKGSIPLTKSEASDKHFQKILRWADQNKRMYVMSTVNNVQDARKAVEFGSDGYEQNVLWDRTLEASSCDCTDNRQVEV